MLLCATASLVSASSVSVVVSADNVFGIWAMAKQRLKQPPRTSKLKHLLTIKMNWRLIKPFTSSLLFLLHKVGGMAGYSTFLFSAAQEANHFFMMQSIGINCA